MKELKDLIAVRAWLEMAVKDVSKQIDHLKLSPKPTKNPAERMRIKLELARYTFLQNWLQAQESDALISISSSFRRSL